MCQSHWFPLIRQLYVRVVIGSLLSISCLSGYGRRASPSVPPPPPPSPLCSFSFFLSQCSSNIVSRVMTSASDCYWWTDDSSFTQIAHDISARVGVGYQLVLSLCPIVSAQCLLNLTAIFVNGTWCGGVLSRGDVSCEKWVHYLQCQCHSEGLYNQNMTIFTLSLLNCWSVCNQTLFDSAS